MSSPTQVNFNQYKIMCDQNGNVTDCQTIVVMNFYDQNSNLIGTGTSLTDQIDLGTMQQIVAGLQEAPQP